MNADPEKVKAYFRQNAVIGQTTRFRKLDRYEAFGAGRQYDHQMYDWWGLSADQMETVSPNVQVPLGFTQPAMKLLARMKRPTAPFHLAMTIVDRFTGLLFSDARKPDVEVEGDEDTDDFLHACMEQCRFWSRWRQARKMGGSSGSVLVTVHVRKGKFVITPHNAKHCQMLWADKRALEPCGALIAYRFAKEEFVRDPQSGEMRQQVAEYVYRRIITEMDDTVYKPVKVGPNASLEWEPEENGQVEHKLEQFPGVWVQNLPVMEDEDGEPDCQGAWQTFDTIDRMLAQMNKALLLNLDPTLKLKLDPKERAAGAGVLTGSDSALDVGSNGEAEYLEMNGSAITVAQALVDRLKQNALDVTRCVLVDPEKISGAAQSAKSIEYVYAPMLEKADELRAQWGEQGVVPLLRIMDTMARKLHGQPAKTADGQPAITTLLLPPKADGTERKLGPGGWIRLKWGPYFSPTETDNQTKITNIISAKSGGIIDQETAVNQGAPIFGVQDPAAMLVKIQAEEESQNASMWQGALGENELPPEPGAGEGGKP